LEVDEGTGRFHEGEATKITGHSIPENMDDTLQDLPVSVRLTTVAGRGRVGWYMYQAACCFSFWF